MTEVRSALAGAAVAVGGRMLVDRAVRAVFERHVRHLNAGDYRGLLSMYAPDAVLRFNDGDHRWSGDHVGRPAIERFLQQFCRAGVRGRIGRMWTAGPPWRLDVAARFDDGATGPDGEELYANRTAIVLRTRWGRITEHEDFYFDTTRIERFERRLQELGVR
jgi:ketosteroid isomerase-like protein